MKKRVLIVEDHPVVRAGLAALISTQDDLEVAAEAGDRTTALDVFKKSRPHVVLLDLYLGKEPTLSLVEDFRGIAPKIPVLVISMMDDVVYAERALRAGALGYVMKSEPADRILAGIRSVLAGALFVTEVVKTRMIEAAIARPGTRAGVEALSDRELDVFERIGAGHTTGEIADALCLSPKTIETYRERIKEKLALSSGAELLQRAIAHNK